MQSKRFARVCLIAVSAVSMGMVGCASEGYEDQRPPVGQLDPRDRGLQSKDIIEASDRMAMDLLKLPELAASDHRWTIVFTGMRNETVSSRQNLDIFIQRLKARVGELGRSRVQIMANREEFRDLQARELETGARDEFGETGGRPTPGPAGINPDFALDAKAMDLAGRATDYYNFEFRLTDFRTREQVWTGMYEVKVAK